MFRGGGNRRHPVKRRHSLIILAGLTLLAAGTSRAQSGYSIQSLVKAGDTIAGVQQLAHFQGGGGGPTINGQTTFLGSDADGNALLSEYAAGKTTLIAAAGISAPGGHFGTSPYWGVTQPVDAILLLTPTAAP
jgi:hypothetical protein